MFFIVTPDAAELTRLAGLADEGQLRPVVSQTFPAPPGPGRVRERRAGPAARQNGPGGPLTAGRDWAERG